MRPTRTNKPSGSCAPMTSAFSYWSGLSELPMPRSAPQRGTLATLRNVLNRVDTWAYLLCHDCCCNRGLQHRRLFRRGEYFNCPFKCLHQIPVSSRVNCAIHFRRRYAEDHLQNEAFARRQVDGESARCKAVAIRRSSQNGFSSRRIVRNPKCHRRRLERYHSVEMPVGWIDYQVIITCNAAWGEIVHGSHCRDEQDAPAQEYMS